MSLNLARAVVIFRFFLYDRILWIWGGYEREQLWPAARHYPSTFMKTEGSHEEVSDEVRIVSSVTKNRLSKNVDTCASQLPRTHAYFFLIGRQEGILYLLKHKNHS
jgi:hypothetical protein